MVLPGFTGFYLVLSVAGSRPSLNWFDQGCTGFYLVLPSFFGGFRGNYRVYRTETTPTERAGLSFILERADGRLRPCSSLNPTFQTPHSPPNPPPPPPTSTHPSGGSVYPPATKNFFSFLYFFLEFFGSCFANVICLRPMPNRNFDLPGFFLPSLGRIGL